MAPILSSLFHFTAGVLLQMAGGSGTAAGRRHHPHSKGAGHKATPLSAAHPPPSRMILRAGSVARDQGFQWIAAAADQGGTAPSAWAGGPRPGRPRLDARPARPAGHHRRAWGRTNKHLPWPGLQRTPARGGRKNFFFCDRGHAVL